MYEHAPPDGDDPPLRQSELTAMTERAAWSWTTRTSGTDNARAFEDRVHLLNEVHRLRAQLLTVEAENAALHETLQAMNEEKGSTHG